MKKQTYRIRRRYGQYATGDEVELTPTEAQRLENEAPGLLEEVGPVEPKPEPKKSE